MTIIWDYKTVEKYQPYQSIENILYVLQQYKWYQSLTEEEFVRRKNKFAYGIVTGDYAQQRSD